jgi:hypothetical protein
MFRVNGSEREKAFSDFAFLFVKVMGTWEVPKPHSLQNKEVPEFFVPQPGHFLYFLFFFSSVNVTVSKSFSTLKFSSGIHAISVLRFPDRRSNESTARARSRKY